MSLKWMTTMAAVGVFSLTLFAAPKIRLEPKSVALGSFPANVEQIGEFTVCNDGDQPLLISKIKSSCGCAVGSVALSELKPGESTVVTVKIVPESIVGPFSKVLFIHSNDPAQAIASVSVSGQSVPLVSVLPQNFLYIGTLTVGQEWRQEFLLQVTEPVDWGELLFAELSEGAVVEVSPVADQELTYQVGVSWRPEKALEAFKIAFQLPVKAPKKWKPVEIVLQGKVAGQDGEKM